MKTFGFLLFALFAVVIIGFYGCSSDDNTSVTTTTGGSGPSTPSNPSPSNNATNVSPSFITLDWTSTDPDPSDTVRFRVYLDRFNPPTNVFASDITNSAVDIGSIQPGTYYWQVVASSDGDTTIGPVWKFSTSP